MHGERRPYSVFGYKGKQVRDNIHSHDLVEAFWQFFQSPRAGEVYNLGGGRHSNCSMLEAIDTCEQITGRKLSWTYVEDNRIGDHIWYISRRAEVPGATTRMEAIATTSAGFSRRSMRLRGVG